MRVAPLGLVPGLTDDQRRGAAQLQSALTHGHPTALAASELTAEAVWLLARGTTPEDLTDTLLEHCRTQRTTYRDAWIDGLAEHAHDHTRTDFVSRGWDECRQALLRLGQALDRRVSVEDDPCADTGEGWIAEEALASGLLCFLLAPDEPVAAVRRGAVSAGDSDSVACLAGAFAGARHGLAAWPAEWVERIEYRADLRELADAWDTPTA
jgi:ADP-ribosylglycohydrolase